jgi:hypothetical protein
MPAARAERLGLSAVFLPPDFPRYRSRTQKTVQGILRQAKIQTTLDLYTQEDGDETLAAQGEYLTALGVATQLVQ